MNELKSRNESILEKQDRLEILKKERDKECTLKKIFEYDNAIHILEDEIKKEERLELDFDCIIETTAGYIGGIVMKQNIRESK